MTLRKTKIVATLGPSSSSEEMLARMIAAGVNVVRLNFSHGLAADHIQRAETVRLNGFHQRVAAIINESFHPAFAGG